MNYTEQDFKNQLKPYSKNGFVAFFQKIGRGWMSAWYGFADKHPTLANLIYMLFFFIVFSQGVTIFQFVVMTFLPQAFQSLLDKPFVWPMVEIPGLTDGTGAPLFYAIFNEPVKFLVNVQSEDGMWQVVTRLANTPEEIKQVLATYGSTYYEVNKAGELIMDAELQSMQVSGLGNFIAFEIAVFLAQCINFPLQRNITYRSHGNPWYQGMWYFIGWVLVSIFTNAVWGIMNPLLMSWNWNEVLIGLIKTVLTGGVSMVIFFFVFLVIFPDDKKAAAKAKDKLDKLVSAKAPAAQIAKAEKTYQTVQNRLDRSTAEKEYRQSLTQANSKALKYFALEKQLSAAVEETKKTSAALEKAKSQSLKVSAVAKLVDAYAVAEKKETELKAKLAESFKAAGEAIATKEEKTQAYNAVMERLGLKA